MFLALPHAEHWGQLPMGLLHEHEVTVGVVLVVVVDVFVRDCQLLALELHSRLLSAQSALMQVLRA
jgi:hypothetical protein